MPDPEVLAALRSIDRSLKSLVAFAQRRNPTAQAGTPQLPGVIAVTPAAPDSDLDSQYGNPPLKFAPRDWTGPSFKGRPFSECPPELLDIVASSLDYFAQQAEEKGEVTPAGKPVAPYKRRDAARARGWARRIRAGWRPPEPEPPDDWGGGEGWQ